MCSKLVSFSILFLLSFSSSAIGFARPFLYQHREAFPASFNNSYLFQNPAFFVSNKQIVFSSYYIRPVSTNEQRSIFSSLNVQFHDKWRTGLTLSSEKPYNYFQFATIGLHLARQFQLADDVHLAAALRVNLNQMNFAMAWKWGSELVEKNYHQPDLDLGLWFRAKKFYAGFSLRHFASPNLTVADSLKRFVPADIYPLHANFTVGHDFNILKKWNFQPNFRCQIANIDNYDSTKSEYTQLVEVSAGAWLGYHDKVSLGVFIMSGQSLVLSARFKFKKKLSVLGSYSEDIWNNRSYQFGINLAL